MIEYSILHQVDPALAAAIDDEQSRQQHKIELIASENFASEAVMEAQGSLLTNKYAEGYPGRRYYGGCEHVDVIEDLARDRAKALFGAEHTNVQPHSGAQANMAAYFALLQPQDKILGMSLAHGGHLTHGSPVNFSGKQYSFFAYGVEEGSEVIDYDKLRAQALEVRPKLIVAGASAYPRAIDFAAMRSIADEAGCLLMTDMAHIAGLVAAGEHMSPVPYCDIVTTTTHKTMRGPRGGMVLCREQYAKAVDKAVFPGIQGGPLMHVIAAKAVALHEAMQPEFKAYQQQVRKNATALGEALLERGFRLVSGGTDNHLLLVDLRPKNITGKDAEHLLDAAGITCNKNAIPFDPLPPNTTSGIRLGSAAMTTRGFKEAEMVRTAEAIDMALSGRVEEAAQLVRQLTDAFPLY